MADTVQSQKRSIRTRNVIIRVLLLLVFGWIVVAVIENLVIPAMTNQYVIVENGHQTLTNVGLALLISDQFEMPLDMQLIQSLRQEYRDSAVKLILSGVSLSGEKLEDTAEQICLTKLWVVEPLPLPEDVTATEESAGLINILYQIPFEKNSVSNLMIFAWNATE